MASELLVHLGRTFVPCLVGSGKGIWLPQSAVSELAFPRSNSLLTTLSSPLERANDRWRRVFCHPTRRANIFVLLYQNLYYPLTLSPGGQLG